MSRQFYEQSHGMLPEDWDYTNIFVIEWNKNKKNLACIQNQTSYQWCIINKLINVFVVTCLQMKTVFFDYN